MYRNIHIFIFFEVKEKSTLINHKTYSMFYNYLLVYLIINIYNKLKVDKSVSFSCTIFWNKITNNYKKNIK